MKQAEEKQLVFSPPAFVFCKNDFADRLILFAVDPVRQ